MVVVVVVGVIVVGSVTVFLPAELEVKVRKIARKHDVSVSRVVQLALEVSLDAVEKHFGKVGEASDTNQE